MPPAIICDNAKEMILLEFNRKLKKALCHLRQTETLPHGQMRLRENQRKVLTRSCLNMSLQRDFGITALNINGPILHMAFTNLMEMYPKRSCPENFRQKLLL